MHELSELRERSKCMALQVSQSVWHSSPSCPVSAWESPIATDLLEWHCM